MKNKEDDYVFPKHIRDGLKKYEDIMASEALTDPDFFIDLMRCCGVKVEKMKDIFTKIGRKDIADEIQEED